MWIAMTAAVIFVGLIGVWLLSRVSVGESRLQIPEQQATFPTVSGYNLEREERVFPRDFTGDLNLVIVPFQQRQQQDVNTWIPAARELEAQVAGFIYYEMPTIYQLPSLSRTFINEGMRAGIPDQTSRERTVTLYLDKEVFKQALGIQSEETIHLFLCDPEGRILWRAKGAYSPQNGEDLVAAIEGALRLP